MSLNAAGKFWVAYALCLLLALAFVSPLARAGAGKVTFDNHPGGVASSSSCADVGAAWLRADGSSSPSYTTCNADPVSVGSTVTVYQSNGAVYWASVVSTLSATPSAGGTNYQPQIDTLSSRVTAVESKNTSQDTAIAALQSGGGAGHTLTDVEYSQLGNVLTAAAAPFDYALAAAVFAFFFSFTVGVWYVSKHFGLIVEAVRRW